MRTRRIWRFRISNVKFMTYWFDEIRCTAFCLIDAPDRETIKRTKRRSICRT